MINSVESEWKLITAGVPHGSILGPLLFLVYVNDITDRLHSFSHLFADDTSLFQAINKSDYLESFNNLNEELDTLSKWANQWKVAFYPLKTEYIIISNNKKKIT